MSRTESLCRFTPFGLDWNSLPATAHGLSAGPMWFDAALSALIQLVRLSRWRNDRATLMRSGQSADLVSPSANRGKAWRATRAARSEM